LTFSGLWGWDARDKRDTFAQAQLDLYVEKAALLLPCGHRIPSNFHGDSKKLFRTLMSRIYQLYSSGTKNLDSDKLFLQKESNHYSSD
jgi:hypothetical protein